MGLRMYVKTISNLISEVKFSWQQAAYNKTNVQTQIFLCVELLTATTVVINLLMIYLVPIKGLSEVIGIIDETVFRKMVRDRRIVTPNIGNF